MAPGSPGSRGDVRSGRHESAVRGVSERRFLYRDGAPDEDDGGGEERCAAIVEELRTVLAPGGIGIVLANWGRRKDEEWSALPRQWLRGSGLKNEKAPFPGLLRSGRWGSNPRPSAWEADALPTELRPRGNASVAVPPP